MAPDDIDRVQEKLSRVRGEIAKRIVGQSEVVERLLVCILCDGNALLESNPGLGKTTLVRTMAEVTDLSFSRIQNTPDLMPSDITGTEIIRESAEGREFVFEKGPVFANIVLADEINRATPKTQAALLEAMQEQQVTAAGATYELPRPFFVLATQNPIDQGGTYPLPEAQTDRFLMKIVVDYPTEDEEFEIVNRYTGEVEAPDVERVLGREELQRAQEYVRQTPIADDIRDRTVRLVRSTREAEMVEYGASPRASMGLVLAAKASAFLAGRSHVSWEDVVDMAPPILRHRILLDFRAEREGTTPDDAVRQLVDQA
ncbi:MoxR family ATPase [Halogeometricum sp. CBA1124]|jgi:MoxR-like ATPase|uniref:AAA family ATPase n=1 Tax=Halogeometricum sp. CBA1124 TaxID=2668071 RepID=UPI00142A22DA|nr:MoxR family ATPase [Halogeometricum sp. CBA1124]MUV57375.1 AAA domain-containing protein [Halogeometricum sp. CBA1124]